MNTIPSQAHISQDASYKKKNAAFVLSVWIRQALRLISG